MWNYAKEITSDEQFSMFVHHMESCGEENKISQLKRTVWYVILSLISSFTSAQLRLMLAEIFDYCDRLAGEQVCNTCEEHCL